MIGESLKEADSADNKYIFLEFNAWLYQGYDDALWHCYNPFLISY